MCSYARPNLPDSGRNLDTPRTSAITSYWNSGKLRESFLDNEACSFGLSSANDNGYETDVAFL